MIRSPERTASPRPTTEDKEMANQARETGPSPAVSADSAFCPECGKPFTTTRGHDSQASSDRASRNWGLIIAGVLFLLVVGIRTWTARDTVITLQSQFQALGQKSPSGLVGPARNPTSVDSEEKFAQFQDLMRAQNRVGEAPIAVGLALIVIVAGLGADGLPGEQSRPKNVATRGRSGDHATIRGVLEPASRRIWVLGHSLSLAAVSLIAAIYCGSVGLLLFKGTEIAPSLFDAALTRTIDAIVTLAGSFR